MSNTNEVQKDANDGDIRLFAFGTRIDGSITKPIYTVHAGK